MAEQLRCAIPYHHDAHTMDNGRLQVRCPGTYIPSEHDCENCLDCIHNGHKCCGCYDGVCCQESPA